MKWILFFWLFFRSQNLFDLKPNYNSSQKISKIASNKFVKIQSSKEHSGTKSQAVIKNRLFTSNFNPNENSKNDIGFVAVNSNARLHDSVDSMDEMIYHATVNEYDFPYVMDKNAKLAKAFGAMKTPHVYLFDANDKLVYTGAIDDNAKSAKRVKNNYLMDALSSLGSGKNIATKRTKALGCSIKFN